MQSIKILLESIYHLLIFFENTNVDSSKDKKNLGSIIFYKDKMSRVFFISENKMFSISFPFFFDIDNKKIYSSAGNEINSKILSYLRSIFYDINEFDFEVVISNIWDNENLYDESEKRDIYDIVNVLLSFEDGYIRYDHDIKNENFKTHPIHHYDIFYSDNNQIKIGLNKHISGVDFIDFLNLNTDCKFLE